MTKTHTVPGSALTFRGAVRFGEFATKPLDGKTVDGQPAKDDSLEPVDADLTILSGEPMSHPWWGRCMFDLAGAVTHKDTYALDYCHDASEIVGKFDRPQVGAAGEYTAKATVIPFTADDRASEIIHRAAAGTPYEASIFFDPGTCKAEYLDDSQVATVNGRQVSGPLTVFRQFDLRGCALCPAGADKFAHAEFLNSGNLSGEFSIPVSGNFQPPTLKVQTMNESQNAAAAAAAAVTETAAAVASAVKTETVLSAEQLRAVEAAQFTAAFGSVDGAAYFAAGETLGSAATKHAAKLSAENAALLKRLEAAGLAGANGQAAGETTAVSSDDGAADTSKLSPLQNRFGKNVGAFMAACKPPSK